MPSRRSSGTRKRPVGPNGRSPRSATGPDPTARARCGSGRRRSGQILGMNIDKSTILDFLRQQGKEDQVAQAEQELPDQVDPERDGGLLSRFGIDVGDLLA